MTIMSYSKLYFNYPSATANYVIECIEKRKSYYVDNSSIANENIE